MFHAGRYSSMRQRMRLRSSMSSYYYYVLILLRYSSMRQRMRLRRQKYEDTHTSMRTHIAILFFIEMLLLLAAHTLHAGH